MASRLPTRRLLLVALAGGALAASSLVAQPTGEPAWSTVFYVQQSFPKQTRTNDQIHQINDAFGVHFDDWSDVANLSAGAQLYRDLRPSFGVGLEVDYSRGSLDGKATVPTAAGPARLAFEQRYSVYANLLAVARYRPCSSCRRVTPFVYAGAGIAYEKDGTTLTLRNEFLDESLRVDNDGTFPVATAGVGCDIDLGPHHAWFLEIGGAYYWGRLKHSVAAHGALAPAPQVTADTDSTGPNYWLGVGWRF